MKVTPTHYQQLAAAIAQIPKERFESHYRVLAAEPRYQIDPKRLRLRFAWDCYYAACKIAPELRDNFKDYLDAHIQTALFRIIPATLTNQENP